MTNLKKIPAIHPWEILLEEFLNPNSLSQYSLAKDISVPSRRINEIVHWDRAITVDTALRLSRYFSTTPMFWLNLQVKYDLETKGEAISSKIDDEVVVFA